MTREAIEKAIKEHENALGLYTSPAGRNTVLRSLVDAVLEEAAKAMCEGCARGWTLRGGRGDIHVSAIDHENIAHRHSLCRAQAIRALKSQETAKPARGRCCERDMDRDGDCDRHQRARREREKP